MHIVEAPTELLFVAHEAIPELMLPQETPRAAPAVQPLGHNLLRIMQHLPEQQGVLRPDQRVSVVRHQYITAE